MIVLKGRGRHGNIPGPALPPPCPTLPPQNSKSRTTFVQAHKINFGTGHKHKFYVYARKHRFMFTCINTKLILGLLHYLLVGQGPYWSFGDTISVPTVARVHFLSSKLWYHYDTSFGCHAFWLDNFDFT
jgi:hypothetical protein